MSRFYDAMARSTGKPIDSLEQLELDTTDETVQPGLNPLEGGQFPDTPSLDWPSAEQPRSEAEDQNSSPIGDQKLGFSEADEPRAEEAPISPAYERIIQRLFSFRRSPRQGVIVVAGAIPGEGVSTVARNTALALGRGHTERVVLVDGNLRHPGQHQEFKTNVTNGLADVLKGRIALTAAMKNEVASGLSLLTAGSPCDSPPRLMTVSALQGIVMALTSLYDWVIIDAPPLTQYPETASIAAACGGALLVVHAERTRSEVADEAKRVLLESGVEVIGAVLNRRKFHIPGFIYRRL